MKRKRLIASEGHIYINGELAGKIVDLPVGDDGDGWREITEEEYAEIMRKETEENDT